MLSIAYSFLNVNKKLKTTITVEFLILRDRSMKTKSKSGAIVRRLKFVRRSKTLSRIELAALAGVKRQASCDIESGKYLPDTALALRLAGRLNCRVEDAFGRNGFDISIVVVTLSP